VLNIKVVKGSKMIVVRHVACSEELGKEYNIVVERCEGGGLDISGRVMETESVCKVVGWIHLAQEEVQSQAVTKMFMGLPVL
jgi:hypothetical protein